MVISADDVRAEWEAISALSRRALNQLVSTLWREQPIVGAYVMAMARDLGTDAFALGTQLALTIDRLYERALSTKSARISEGAVERADAAVEQSAAKLVGVEPELALQRVFSEREFAQPEIPFGLIQIMMEDTDEEESVGIAGFIIAKTLALAYEYANDMQAEGKKLGSFAEVAEEQTGQPLPKVGRNEPCPCGSTKKFKHCHGDTSLREVSTPSRPRADQLFWDYMDLIGATMEFFREMRSQPAGKRHWDAFEHFETEFRVGDDGGVFDSMQIGYFLFDLPLPKSQQTVGERFLLSRGGTLNAAEKVRLRHLISSHLGFYEYVERCADTPKKQLRDLVTGQLWLASGVDDPAAEHDSPGDIMIVRLVGAIDDAVMTGMPVLLAPAAKPVLAGMGRQLVDNAQLQGKDLIDNNRVAMKAAVPAIANFLVSAGLLEDDDDDLDDDDLDDDDLDDDDDEWEEDPDFEDDFDDDEDDKEK